MLLLRTMHEEDRQLRLDHLYKVEVEGMLVLPSEGDKDTEDDAVVHGIAVVKVDSRMLPRLELAHSVTAVASMDTLHRGVQRQPVHLAVVILPSL